MKYLLVFLLSFSLNASEEIIRQGDIVIVTSAKAFSKADVFKSCDKHIKFIADQYYATDDEYLLIPMMGKGSPCQNGVYIKSNYIKAY